MPDNKPVDGEPTAAELASWRTWFITGQKPADVSVPDWRDEVNSVFLEDVNERSRTEIMADVIVWMQQFPLVTP
jgi:hypothetical protein